ncbi:MAG: ABC transporter ATP-binding protein [Cellulosilyticaceae bacterium]
MESYIKFENISKRFKQEQVLKDINFELEKGKIYGFVGRNGSGKTVIFKLLTGLLRPTEGNIYINEINMTKSKRFPESIGVLIETPGFIPHYSGLKNLKVLNSLSKEKADVQKVKDSMKLVGLDADNNKPVKTYSLGMKQKLGIAQAIMNKPKLLILDEPMNGLDEQSVGRMREFFQNLKQNKEVTILLASHNKEDIQILCDKLFYIDNGVITAVDEVK